MPRAGGRCNPEFSPLPDSPGRAPREIPYLVLGCAPIVAAARRVYPVPMSDEASSHAGAPGRTASDDGSLRVVIAYDDLSAYRQGAPPPL